MKDSNPIPRPSEPINEYPDGLIMPIEKSSIDDPPIAQPITENIDSITVVVSINKKDYRPQEEHPDSFKYSSTINKSDPPALPQSENPDKRTDSILPNRLDILIQPQDERIDQRTLSSCRNRKDRLPNIPPP